MYDGGPDNNAEDRVFPMMEFVDDIFFCAAIHSQSKKVKSTTKWANFLDEASYLFIYLFIYLNIDWFTA